MGAACSLPTQEMPAHLSSTHVWWAPGPSVHRGPVPGREGLLLHLPLALVELEAQHPAKVFPSRQEIPERYLSVADVGDPGQSPTPRQLIGKDRPAFYGLQLLSAEGRALALPTAACSVCWTLNCG